MFHDLCVMYAFPFLLYVFTTSTTYLWYMWFFTFLAATPVPEKENEKSEEPSDSVEEESSDKGTVSPEEKEKLKEEIIKVQEEDAEKFGLPLTSKPDDIETFLKAEENEYGEEMPEKVEEELAESDNEFVNFVHFLRLFDEVWFFFFNDIMQHFETIKYKIYQNI